MGVFGSVKKQAVVEEDLGPEVSAEDAALEASVDAEGGSTPSSFVAPTGLPVSDAPVSDLEKSLGDIGEVDLAALEASEGASQPKAAAPVVSSSYEMPQGLPVAKEPAPAPAPSAESAPADPKDPASDPKAEGGSPAEVEVPEDIRETIEKVRRMIDSFDLSEDEKKIVMARYENYLMNAILPRIQEIGRNRQDYEKVMGMHAREANSAASPAGFLASLFGRTGPRVDNGFFKDLNAQERRVGEDLGSFASEMSGRIRGYKLDRTRRDLMDVAANEAAVIRSTSALNAAVLASAPARAAIEAHAVSSGTSAESVLERMRAGDRPPEVVAALEASAADIAADPTVAAMSDVLSDCQENYARAAGSSVAGLEAIHNIDGDAEEPRNLAEKLRESVENLASSESPLLDASKRAEFNESMRKLSESIAAMIRRMVERIFGAANEDAPSAPAMSA